MKSNIVLTIYCQHKMSLLPFLHPENVYGYGPIKGLSFECSSCKKYYSSDISSYYDIYVDGIDAFDGCDFFFRICEICIENDSWISALGGWMEENFTKAIHKLQNDLDTFRIFESSISRTK